MSTQLPASLRLGPVHLTTRNLRDIVPFYKDLLGLETLVEEKGVRWLGAGARPLVVLHEAQDAPLRRRGTTGLYHYALLLPDRPALGWALQSLIEADYPLQGAADHLVSEAIYLPDPDGNGIELYRDRPRSQWEYRNGTLRMATEPLDARGVLEAGAGRNGPAVGEGTVVGHVHLHVSDLAEAERFYGESLGFDLVTRYGQQAAFYSVGGYHHQIGINTWAGIGAPAPPSGATGLRYFTAILPRASDLGELADRLEDEGVPFDAESGRIEVADPSDNRLRIELGDEGEVAEPGSS